MSMDLMSSQCLLFLRMLCVLRVVNAGVLQTMPAADGVLTVSTVSMAFCTISTERRWEEAADEADELAKAVAGGGSWSEEARGRARGRVAEERAEQDGEQHRAPAEGTAPSSFTEM